MIDPALKTKWGLYEPGDLRQHCSSTTTKYLVNDLLAARSICMLIGDSGLGKTPLVYQLAVCIAAGVPFLDHLVAHARVLYVDFENGLGDVEGIIEGLVRHLGLPSAPEELALFNVNDCSPNWGRTGYGMEDLIADTKPGLVILDPLTGYCPEVEEKNSTAVQLLQRFRRWNRTYNTNLVATHNIKKPTTGPGGLQPDSLEDADLHSWFLQARGPRALINACDVRLGVDYPGSSQAAKIGDVALVLRGFRRVRGEIETTYLERLHDATGEPLGYRRITGPGLLFNPDQAAAFAKLPTSFRFKEAQQVYGKGGQATTDFLNKCLNIGILRRASGRYEKSRVDGA